MQSAETKESFIFHVNDYRDAKMDQISFVFLLFGILIRKFFYCLNEAILLSYLICENSVIVLFC